MKKETNEDRRILRTKRLLTDALVSLLKVKSIQNISVKELCDTADINRSTFYLHYKDIYDMMQQIENDILEQFEQLFTHHRLKDMYSDPYDLLHDIFLLTLEYSELFQTLLSPNGDISFLMEIKYLFRNRYLEIFLSSTQEKDTTKLEYSYSFIVNGCLGLIERWVNSGQKETPEEMAALASSIITTGIRFFTL